MGAERERVGQFLFIVMSAMVSHPRRAKETFKVSGKKRFLLSTGVVEVRTDLCLHHHQQWQAPLKCAIKLAKLLMTSVILPVRIH